MKKQRIRDVIKELIGAKGEISAFLRKQMKAIYATSILVLIFFAFVSSAIGLFHCEECFLDALNKGKANVPASDEHCLACIFAAGFKSFDADYGLPVLGIKSPIAFQSIQHFVVAHHYEWSYSILLRAPPLTSAS